MESTEKIKMYLNIGGSQIAVTVPFSQQDTVRDVEKQVNDLYTSWRHQFSKKTDREIMAMVAYQFASHYHELRGRYAEAGELARECLDAMDRLDQEEQGTTTA